MTFHVPFQRVENLTKPGRCTRCRRIGPRILPLGLCRRCEPWREGGAVGPVPLPVEEAEPYRLDDPNYVPLRREAEDDDAFDVLIRAMNHPDVQEALEWVGKHRNYDCEHYDGCLRIACHVNWYFFSCKDCRLFLAKKA